MDAVEPSEHRADLVRRAVDGLPVTVHTADGRDAPLPDGAYDRVLVDAPCTGLGALRRRPEARWRRRPDDVAALAKLQRELLTAALRHVRPGGVVAYVTCSPHLAETVGVLRRVLRSHRDVEQLDARPTAARGARPRRRPDRAAVAAPARHRRDVPRLAAPAGRVTCAVPPMIAPSILAADFARLADEAADRRRASPARGPTGCTST